MPDILSSGRVEHKIQLLGSMFPEKIEFDGEKYRINYSHFWRRAHELVVVSPPEFRHLLIKHGIIENKRMSWSLSLSTEGKSVWRIGFITLALYSHSKLILYPEPGSNRHSIAATGV